MRGASVHVIHVAPMPYGAAGVFGGGERYPLELARAMARQTRTTLLTFGAEPGEHDEGPLHITVLPLRGHLRDAINPLSERLLPALRRAELVHVHHLESVLTDVALLATWRRPTPVFGTNHGGRSRHLHHRLRARWHDGLGGHLAVSRFALEEYPRLVAGGSVIFGGADRPDPAAPTVQRERKVVQVGRLLPHKGAHLLIQATPPDVALHLYGRPYDLAYAAELRRLAEGRDVTFHTGASDDEVTEAYRTARAVVMASTKDELLGLTLLEAQAQGTPVVAAATGGMPEVVDEGRTGFVVPSGDVAGLAAALSRLVDGGREWDRMSAAASATAAAEYTWDAVANRCLVAYAQA